MTTGSMTREVCDVVAERVALGEPLGDAAAHAASCARCTALAALPVELARGGRVEPGAGFTARMTIGARRRLVVRKRRRVATGTLAAIAAAVLGVFAATRSPGTPDAPAVATHPTSPTPPAPSGEPAAPDEIRELVRIADVDHSRHLSAHWARIEAPLAPYRAFVKGVTP